MSVTTCAAAQELIDAFVTESLSAADAASLADHVRTCPACAARLGSMTRLAALLGTLPEVEPSPGFEARQVAVVLADRARRHEHRSWLAELRVQVFRGAVRTTGTLAATVAAVALLGAAFVLAASNLFPGVVQQVLQGHSTPHPTAPITAAQPPTASPSPAPVTPSPEATPAPATPRPTQAPATAPSTPALTASPAATPTLAPTPTPIVVVVAPTAPPSPAASPTPTPSPTPSPTPKPRRCPPGTACYSPSPTPAPASPSSP
jgi:hypothetical protein